MKREIKFRAWDKTYNCWYKPTHRAYEGKLWELMVGLSGDLSAYCMRLGKTELVHESIFPDRYELMQFTGLKDKNGGEIYEGDIVRFEAWEQFHDIMRINISVVEYKEYGFTPFIWQTVVEDGWYNYEIENPEVIGNIYENPELLK